MTWIYHQPSFAYEGRAMASAWDGHQRFAYDLVRYLKPKRVVELGTHYGLSFFSFCQAVKDAGLRTRCYAVDTWQGDGHTGGYPEEVYNTVSRMACEHYAKNAVLLRSTFDEALPKFRNGSISLLHIDGFHTYEAVSHDYRTWLPKLAENGVVLLHDIHVYIDGFGVRHLWDELKDVPRFEFTHAYGLGVLFPKGCPDEYRHLIALEQQFRAYYGG